MADNTVVAIEEKAKAGYPAIYLQTSEYTRALREVAEVCEKTNRTLFTWTLSKGLSRNGTNKYFAETDGPSNALDFMATGSAVPEKSIIVMPLMHHFLEDPGVQAKLIDLLQNFKSTKRMLIIISPVVKIPSEIEKEMALMEMRLPDKKELKEVLSGIVKGSKLKDKGLEPDEATEKILIESALGMTTAEAENALSLSLVRSKDKGKWDSDVVMEEKCSTLKKTGLLTYYPPGSQGMKQVGGMANLKEWISKRRRAFTDEAKKFGLPPPKGILTVGPPGAGKSLGAKAISEELTLPLLRCDMGRIFAGLVGASEENARRVIQTAEAVAPCVLWLDEIEKGFAGAGGSGNLDSGVGSRVLGTFLTWMQEKTTSVFVYATANNVSALPPELLRKGRFDETFSVMLPNADERSEIFQIHLSKRGQTLKDYAIGDLVGKSEGFSGAELEALIIEAMFTAFSNNRKLSGMDILSALEETKPLSVTMKENIDRMAEWCEGRTRPANAKAKLPPSKPGAGGRAVEA